MASYQGPLNMQERIDQGLMTEAAARAAWLKPAEYLTTAYEQPRAPVPDPRQTAQPPGTTPPMAAMSVAAVVARIPIGPVKDAVVKIFQSLGRISPSIGWSRLPDWLRTVLIWLGIPIGHDFFFDLAPGGGGGDSDMIQLAPTNGLQHITHGANVVGTWEANGVVFMRLSDGKLAVRRKNGTVRVWRPKKPIVLYASGAKDLKTMIRADKALDKQARQLAKVLSRRAPKPSSRRAPRQAATLVEVVNPGRLVGQ